MSIPNTKMTDIADNTNRESRTISHWQNHGTQAVDTPMGERSRSCESFNDEMSRLALNQPMNIKY